MKVQLQLAPQNNLFVGNGTTVSGGTVTQATNLRTNTPNFVNIGAFDYRPTAATPGIDPTNRETRPTRNAVDIGAYEFVP